MAAEPGLTLTVHTAEPGGHSALVDLSGVAFTDSTGPTCLIAVYRTARNIDVRPALIAPRERVRHMPAPTGTDRVLHGCPTLDPVSDRPPR